MRVFSAQLDHRACVHSARVTINVKIATAVVGISVLALACMGVAVHMTTRRRGCGPSPGSCPGASCSG
eukprot:11503795-Alexandrium_andersonii.AAC.1